MIHEDGAKCPSCGWRVSRLYVLADSAEEAGKLFDEGLGLCADCFLEMLIEGDYEVAEKHG